MPRKVPANQKQTRGLYWRQLSQENPRRFADRDCCRDSAGRAEQNVCTAPAPRNMTMPGKIATAVTAENRRFACTKIAGLFMLPCSCFATRPRGGQRECFPLSFTSARTRSVKLHGQFGISCVVFLIGVFLSRTPVDRASSDEQPSSATTSRSGSAGRQGSRRVTVDNIKLLELTQLQPLSSLSPHSSAVAG